MFVKSDKDKQMCPFCVDGQLGSAVSGTSDTSSDKSTSEGGITSKYNPGVAQGDIQCLQPKLVPLKNRTNPSTRACHEATVTKVKHSVGSSSPHKSQYHAAVSENKPKSYSVGRKCWGPPKASHHMPAATNIATKCKQIGVGVKAQHNPKHIPLGKLTKTDSTQNTSVKNKRIDEVTVREKNALPDSKTKTQHRLTKTIAMATEHVDALTPTPAYIPSIKKTGRPPQAKLRAPRSRVVLNPHVSAQQKHGPEEQSHDDTSFSRSTKTVRH